MARKKRAIKKVGKTMYLTPSMWKKIERRCKSKDIFITDFVEGVLSKALRIN